MAYTFTEAASPMSIAEREYKLGRSEIRFTNFTSCIGLIRRTGDEVGGVHLVIVSKDGTVFNQDAANEAIHLITPYKEVVVIGQTGFWEDNVGQNFQYLLNGLQNKTVISKGDGIYGGRVHQGTFQVYVDGEYQNV